MGQVIAFLGDLQTDAEPSKHLMDFVPHIHRIELCARILIVDTNPDDATSKWFNLRRAHRESLDSIRLAPEKSVALLSTHYLAYLSLHSFGSVEFVVKLISSLCCKFDYILIDAVRNYFLNPASLLPICNLFVVPSTPNSVVSSMNNFDQKMPAHQVRVQSENALVLFVMNGFLDDENLQVIQLNENGLESKVWRGTARIQSAFAKKWPNIKAQFCFVHTWPVIPEALAEGLGTTEVAQSEFFDVDFLEEAQQGIQILNKNIWESLKA